MAEREMAITNSGRRVVVCYCDGGPHEWKPNGGGVRILACPSWDPVPRPKDASPSSSVITGQPTGDNR